MSKASIDDQIQKLFDVVQSKKEEIAKAQKPSWNTNGSFGYSRDNAKRFNIQTINDLDELAYAMSFLLREADFWDASREELGLPEKEFKWLGYTFEEWKTDFQTRISKVSVKEKKKELESLESRLDKIVSPEKRREMEFAAISAALED